jgi:starvation-inducible DNA-binding protein
MPAKPDGKRANGAVTVNRFKTAIDLPAETRSQLNRILNQNLADTSDLYSQIKHAHWNVRGKDFFQLHELFDTLAACAQEWADLIAERVGQLGGYATGTVRMAAESSQLPEFPADIDEGMDVVRALVERYAIYCGAIRSCINQTDGLGDPTTADLLTEVSRDADKNLWFLEAHLQA